MSLMLCAVAVFIHLRGGWNSTQHQFGLWKIYTSGTKGQMVLEVFYDSPNIINGPKLTGGSTVAINQIVRPGIRKILSLTGMLTPYRFGWHAVVATDRVTARMPGALVLLDRHRIGYWSRRYLSYPLSRGLRRAG